MSENVYKNGSLKKTAGLYAVDAELSDTSTNAVQNKVIKGEIDSINASLANCVTYNSTDDYLYIGETKWKRAYLGAFYLLKNGVLSDGYSLGKSLNYASFTTLDGGMSYTQSKGVYGNSPTTDLHFRSSILTKTVDISSFGSIHVKYLQGSTENSFVKDISSLEGEYYLLFALFYNSNSQAGQQHPLFVGLSSSYSISNFSECVDSGWQIPSGNSGEYTFTDVWFE